MVITFLYFTYLYDRACIYWQRRLRLKLFLYLNNYYSSSRTSSSSTHWRIIMNNCVSRIVCLNTIIDNICMLCTYDWHIHTTHNFYSVVDVKILTLSLIHSVFPTTHPFIFEYRMLMVNRVREVHVKKNKNLNVDVSVDNWTSTVINA